MDIKKNNYYNIEILDLGTNGEGIGKISGFTIFVNYALPKEIVFIKIIKVKKNYAYAKLIKIIKKSPKRLEPPCKYYQKCGGCNLQHLEYFEQLNLKTNIVLNNIKKIGKINNFEIFDTIPAPNKFYYRNKMQLPINFKNENINIGFYSPRSHNIINISNCLIQNKINDLILKKTNEVIKENNIIPYNEDTNLGTLRHVITRVSLKTNQIVICFVINDKTPNLKKILIEKFKHIQNLSGLILNFNNKKTNVILGEKNETILGENYIIDFIKDIKFKVSIFSFYQINPVQTEVLYDKVLDFANLNGDEIVIDAYCGIGTISLFLAKKCKKVYGIEIVKSAIEDAFYNSNINNIKNTDFILGKAEEKIRYLIYEKKVMPDLIVLDPPRKGCDKELLKSIVFAKPKKVIYVSCDSATLSRDLKYLCENGFVLKKVQPIDMFCMTTHVETVCLLEYKKL